MEFSDRTLKCIDCGLEFVFTAGEQLFFHDKQFKNDPRHCKQCKAKRTKGGPKVRPETRTTCSECRAETTVPFKPTQGRPVLCRSCFQKQLSKPKQAIETISNPEPSPVDVLVAVEGAQAEPQPSQATDSIPEPN
jgi:CxxC-x17-CxxC domain-containing protein